MFPQATAFFLIFIVLLTSLHVLSFILKKPKKLPPGPRALPIIGNLHNLGKLPHQTLCNLARKYGPIMSIKLGFVTTIIVSSPEAAELFLKTHDHIFASRPKVQASEIFSYGSKAMAFSEYGPYWRNVRKLCVLQLLSTSKIESFRQMRMQEMELTVELLKKASLAHEVVNISTMVAELSENMTYKMVLGTGKDEESNLKENVKEILILTGAFNISDYVPLLAPFDLQGLARRMKSLSKSLDKVLEKIIKDHEQKPKHADTRRKDFVDVLLSMLNQPMNSQDEQTCIIDRPHVKAILLDMMVAALESSTTVVEWTLSELLKNPRVMLRLQNELNDAIGLNRMVQETDLSKLTYLDFVVRESLRLHPVVPLLVPRESREDISIGGYSIPKKSRVLVNVWAMGRDPNVWSNNANEFLPERFLDDDIDVRGHDFRLIPFGAGRRKCPGLQLGLRNVRFALAQLVHCFHWKLPDGIVAEELDMTEKFGLSVARANHLHATPIYRLCC